MAIATIKLVTIKLHQGSAPYNPIAKHAIEDNKIETGKQNLEIKKSQVTNNLIDYFIQHSIDVVIDKVNKEINKEVFIPMGAYHRLIKGTNDLKIKLIKNPS